MPATFVEGLASLVFRLGTVAGFDSWSCRSVHACGPAAFIAASSSTIARLTSLSGSKSPVPERALVDLALESSDQGKGKTVVRRLADGSCVTYQNGRGYRVKNDPDAQAKAAYRLTVTCGYPEIQVEPTLSRFDQAGGSTRTRKVTYSRSWTGGIEASGPGRSYPERIRGRSHSVTVNDPVIPNERCGTQW